MGELMEQIEELKETWMNIAKQQEDIKQEATKVENSDKVELKEENTQEEEILTKPNQSHILKP